MGFGLKLAIAGDPLGAVTARFTELLACLLGLVTCTGKVCALVPTLTLAVNCELLTKVTDDP